MADDMSLAPVYTVTLNWNLQVDTIACVESVLAAGVPRAQVIIVDNGSTDGSVTALAARFGPELQLVCNAQNLGFGGGMNEGIRHALEHGAGSVLLLNNDTVVDPGMATALLEAYDSLGRPGILGPAIYYYDVPGRIWRLGDIVYRWLPMPLPARLNGKSLSALVPFQVDYVTGCGMLVCREVFERVGLFDRRYFMYFEDADFCGRARDAGFAVWCVPRARMWHKVSATARRDGPVNRYHRALNQVRFYHEHAHGRSAVLREGYIAAKLLKTTMGDVWHRDWDLVGPLWKGTLDGYREQARRMGGPCANLPVDPAPSPGEKD